MGQSLNIFRRHTQKRFVNRVLREGALTGGGAVIGTAFGGFPFGTVGGAGIGWAFEVAADYCLSDYGASVGDERIWLRYSLTTSNLFLVIKQYEG